MALHRTWIEARQQAAEEDLEMPVVLEEFGCKLDKRPAQYKLAYDSCLTSAKRHGSCAGVMFWDLAHAVRIPTVMHGVFYTRQTFCRHSECIVLGCHKSPVPVLSHRSTRRMTPGWMASCALGAATPTG